MQLGFRYRKHGANPEALVLVHRFTQHSFGEFDDLVWIAEPEVLGEPSGVWGGRWFGTATFMANMTSGLARMTQIELPSNATAPTRFWPGVAKPILVR